MSVATYGPADPLDVMVTHHGTIVMVAALTDAAKAWAHQNIEPGATWMANSFAVEPRYLEPILSGMVADGLTVASPGGAV